MRCQWSVLIAALLVCRGALALGPGDLDPDFNGGQPLLFDIAAMAPRLTSFSTVLADAEGRYLAIGIATDSDGKTAIAVVRVTPQGAADGTFGSSGVVLLQAGQGPSPYSQSTGAGISPSGLLVGGV
jgi:hypothetical protein